MTRKDAVKILLNETPTDYIMDEHEAPDFFQFHVSCGGDACAYRIYKKDGSIYER